MSNHTPTPVPSEVAETTAGEHHPACYQSTGVPDHLPAGLCDCKVLRMLDAAETTAGEREVEAWEYAIEGDWLVQVVNKHTCGTGPDGYYGAHEPGCGSIPVADIGPLLDRVRREEGERIAQAIDEEDGSFGVGEGYGGEYDKGVHRGLQDAARIARAASVGPSD